MASYQNKVWYLWHCFGCPEKYLTKPYKVRVCTKCSRYQFESKEVEQVFMESINKK